MDGPLMASFERACALGLKLRSLLQLNPAVVAVSAVMTDSVEVPRFLAIMDAVEASTEAGVPHIIMLDSSSHTDATSMLEARGAIVIEIDHDTEGGLGRPFVIAAQIIEMWLPNAIMVKFEGEKPLFESGRNVIEIIEAAADFDILTGERSDGTWSSMPPYQVTTELWLGLAIGKILGVSNDTPSGVIILNSAGRRVFMETTTLNSWPYLFTTPREGLAQGLKVGIVEVDFRYHQSVVKEEEGNPVFDAKRRSQLDLMLTTALEMAGGEECISGEALALVCMLRSHREALERLA